MTHQIRKATVIGAGAMGSGIAAQLANAGINVHLLDIVPQDIAKNGGDRNIVARSAIERMKKATPDTDPLSAGFMDASNAKRIVVGNLEDDLEDAVKDCDWVIEVVVEDLAIKKNLFEKIDAFRREDTIVTSNTSTIPLHDLTGGRSESFKQHFAITHFFNPPRFMRLLELVSGKDTLPAVTDILRDTCDVMLGKKVIAAKDSPAFIANRIGTYFMFRTIVETIDRKMKIEDADAIMGRPLGFPKDGVFGLLDLVGIGITPHLTNSLERTLPEGDAFRQIDNQRAMEIVNEMLEDGRSGRRSEKGGFYRMQKNADGSRNKQVLDLESGTYRNVEKNRLASVTAGKKGPRAVFQAGDEGSELAWVVMRDTLLYAASLVPEISDSVADIDTAMREGYNWKHGPFEMLDRIGLDYFIEKTTQDGITLPPVLEMARGKKFYTIENNTPSYLCFDFANNTTHYAPESRDAGVIALEDFKRGAKPLVHHHSASLWDIGDGVTCFEFHSKMNTLEPSVLYALNESIKFINDNSEKYKAMVIYNDGSHFSLGANIGLISKAFDATRNKFVRAAGLGGVFERGLYRAVEDLIYQGQAIYKALREAPFPVIGAPSGRALGGGCEILLHCDAIQAHAETYMGLVESGIGILPGWGGCERYLERTFEAQKDGLMKKGPFPPVRQAFMALMMPQHSISMSGQDAKKKLWLRKTDGVTMNRDRLLTDAKTKAMAMVPSYTPPAPAVFHLPGKSAATSIKSALDDLYLAGQATSHDIVVADALADVLTGGDTHIGVPTREEDMIQRERENFLSLAHTRATQDRIKHTFEKGRPLREGPSDTPIDTLRANRHVTPLEKRVMDGKPLTGKEEQTLGRMAAATAFILKYFS